MPFVALALVLFLLPGEGVGGLGRDEEDSAEERHQTPNMVPTWVCVEGHEPP